MPLPDSVLSAVGEVLSLSNVLQNIKSNGENMGMIVTVQPWRMILLSQNT